MVDETMDFSYLFKESVRSDTRFKESVEIIEANSRGKIWFILLLKIILNQPLIDDYW